MWFFASVLTLVPVMSRWYSCEIPTSDRALMVDIMRHYDKNSVPSPSGIDVSVDLLIQSIEEISESRESVTADLLFSEIWMDSRLRYNHLTSCVTNLTLGYQMVDRIWLPTVG